MVDGIAIQVPILGSPTMARVADACSHIDPMTRPMMDVHGAGGASGSVIAEHAQEGPFTGPGTGLCFLTGMMTDV
jgi:hypothetical protein